MGEMLPFFFSLISWQSASIRKMKIMHVGFETTPKLLTFFCSFPNKYSCFLQVLWVACGIKENNSKNKVGGGGVLFKLNIALSFSQLESLEKVS